MDQHIFAGAALRLNEAISDSSTPSLGCLSWHFEFEVFPFEQTYLDNARQISGLNSVVRQGSMTMPKNDKYKDYARYAERCFIQREMAAEWLRLADAIRRPRRSKQMQIG
jgi:hypothetical protein